MQVLESIVTGFNAIINLLKLGFTTLGNMVKALAYFLQWLFQIFGNAMDIADFMPYYVSSFIYLSIGITVLMLIVGRTGGKSD